MRILTKILAGFLFSLVQLQIAQATPSPQMDEQIIHHVNTLNELSARRQISTFFSNEQSIVTSQLKSGISSRPI